MKKNGNVSLMVAVVALLMVTAFSSGVLISPYLNPTVQAAQTTDPTAAGIMAQYEQAMTEIYQNTVPGVVYINVVTSIENPLGETHEGLPFMPDMPEDFMNRGQGSGFVWDQSGHIVTNNHVVDGATEIEVIFADGTEVEAELLGTDPNSDLAVIKVDSSAVTLTPIPLGDSAALRPGQLAIALGNPFGQDFTMTTGIVSAIERTIRSGNGPFSIPEAIQTDAPINPGNSGGPLLNRKGEVIGINTQIMSQSMGNSGIGFAVPINIAKDVVPILIEGGDYEYAWLGISGSDMTDEIAEAMSLPLDTRGALIINLTDDGPAKQAGLQGGDNVVEVEGLDYQLGGDVITAIEGEPVRGMDDLIAYLGTVRPGDTVTITVLRDNGETAQIEVVLGKRPDPTDIE